MVTTWQAILFGVALAYTPMAVIFVFILWRDGALSRLSPHRYKLHEILTSERVPYTRLAFFFFFKQKTAYEMPLINQTELAQRISFLNSCKFALVQVGFE